MALTPNNSKGALQKTGFVLIALAVLGLFTGVGVAQEEEKKEEAPKFERILQIPAEVIAENTTSDAYKQFGLLDADEDVINNINKRIQQGWADNNVTPSSPANDFEFARRAYLDIIGRIPTPEEIVAFASQKTARRVWLVNKLLASEEYPRHWANLWANWSLGRAGVFGAGLYKNQLQDWFRDEFATNTPWNEVVRKVLIAEGRNTDNGAVNFMLAHVGEPTPNDKRRSDGQFDMVPLTSRITRLFLGIQTQCTQCHDHPFDANLQQKHFWGVNAFLRQIEREGTLPANNNNNPGPLTLKINTETNITSVVRYEKRNGVLLETTAKFLDGTRLARDMRREDRRPELAKFIVSHDNFPRAFANRMWGTFLGKGFVHPLDDFNDTNVPSHPDLLDELGAAFKNYNYDQKRLIRWIVLSDAYNLSAIANKTNDKPEHQRFFSRMILKAMSPEQLFESMMIASKQKKPGEDAAALRAQWLGQLVANFGDDEGNEITFNGTIVQALLMMNGNEIDTAITSGKGTVKHAMDTYKGDGFKRVNYLYLATVSRPVTKEEYARIVRARFLRNKQDIKIEDLFHDIFWGLLNSNEFILNH